MRKQTFPLLSLMLALTLAISSFAPVFAASDPLPSGILPPPPPAELPVKLNLSFDAKTREVTVITAFQDKSVQIDYGRVLFQNKAGDWTRKTKHTDTNRIVLSHVVPNKAGYYCAEVNLYVFEQTQPPAEGGTSGWTRNQIKYQGSRSKCIFVGR